VGSNKPTHITVCFEGKELKLFLYLSNYALSREGVWGSGSIIDISLTSAIVGSERPALPLGNEPTGTSRTALDDVDRTGTRNRDLLFAL
jgi:hypothetical protein